MRSLRQLVLALCILSGAALSIHASTSAAQVSSCAWPNCTLGGGSGGGLDLSDTKVDGKWVVRSWDFSGLRSSAGDATGYSMLPASSVTLTSTGDVFTYTIPENGFVRGIYYTVTTTITGSPSVAVKRSSTTLMTLAIPAQAAATTTQKKVDNAGGVKQVFAGETIVLNVSAAATAGVASIGLVISSPDPCFGVPNGTAYSPLGMQFDNVQVTAPNLFSCDPSYGGLRMQAGSPDDQLYRMRTIATLAGFGDAATNHADAVYVEATTRGTGGGHQAGYDCVYAFLGLTNSITEYALWGTGGYGPGFTGQWYAGVVRGDLKVRRVAASLTGQSAKGYSNATYLSDLVTGDSGERARRFGLLVDIANAKVKYYVDRELKATQTTDIPTATMLGQSYLVFTAHNPGTVSAGCNGSDGSENLMQLLIATKPAWTN